MGQDWSNEESTVQEIWNEFEIKLIKIVDEIVPMTEFRGINVKVRQCPVIKCKLNLRNRLFEYLT